MTLLENPELRDVNERLSELEKAPDLAAAAEPLLVQYWPRYVAGHQSLDATIDQIVRAMP